MMSSPGERPGICLRARPIWIGAEFLPVTTAFAGFPMRPRSGRTLLVLIVARIGTVHQDVRSLDDQVAQCKRYVAERHDGPVEFVVVQG